MNTEDFGKKLLRLRQNLNMTQEELALRMGVTPQAISKWERGQSLPDVSILAQLCKALNVSADLLLGLERHSDSGSTDLVVYHDLFTEELFMNLRDCLDPLALVFGTGLIPVFVGGDGDYLGLASKLRMELSQEGILLPVLRLRDHKQLEENEFMVLAYNRVLYQERVENIDGTTLEHMCSTLGRVVRENYGLILNRDLVKALTDNLKLRYPALIEGVVPEKISYGLLQEVLKKFVSRGNSPLYLCRIIESLETALYKNPAATVEQLAEQVCKDLETPDNLSILLAQRHQKTGLEQQ